MAASKRSVIAEIEGIFASGSTERQVDVLRRVTDLFLAEADSYSDEHVDLFDGVITRIAEKIEVRAKAELARRLAPSDKAPPNTLRMLARDPSIDVAGPILTHSPRLSDDELVKIAGEKSQERMLAISKRRTLSERVSDVLVTHGNRDVVLSVTRNEGARISDIGEGELGDRASDDEGLGRCVAAREDITRDHFNSLIAKASTVVFDKLTASNPDAVYEVHKVLTDITGTEAGTQPPAKRDYREAAAQFAIVRRSGKPIDPIVREYAAGGQFEMTVAALSALSGAPIKLVDGVMNDGRSESDFVLILAKAGGLSWPTTKEICKLRRKSFVLSSPVVNAAQRSFDRLLPATAQRLVRFYNERHSAVANFQQLAQQIRTHDGAQPVGN